MIKTEKELGNRGLKQKESQAGRTANAKAQRLGRKRRLVRMECSKGI
jgi:hypothetical protein